jgi:DNA-directed RNA polymerase sigma subunit (sigma70/sigma32)
MPLHSLSLGTVLERRRLVNGTLPDGPVIDLSVLTPRQRLVIVLHYYCDWTYGEIAQAIGISDVTLRQDGSRALSRLRDEMEP